MKSLKNISKTVIMILLITIIGIDANAQRASKTSLTVLNIDVQGLSYTPQQLGNLTRIEIEKLDTFEVMDRYDVSYLVEKNNLKIDNCYGKIGLTEVGKIINAEKMLSGSAETYGKTIILTLRLIDVKSSKIEKTHVREFLDIPEEIQEMIKITVKEMFGREVNPVSVQRLTKKHQYESAVTNPNKNTLNLSGPRLGMTYFTGDVAHYLISSKNDGGFGAQYPAMFMFGYQFEIQYLNEGNFQALFEFIPTITGVDQGLIMPSISILNGLRHNLYGWELALGPIAGITKKAKGYYENGVWHLESDWNNATANPNPTEERMDSRGRIAYHTGFVFGFGKSFKSGKLNIPVNMFVIPSNNGIRFGLTFGYNVRKNNTR